MRPETRSQIVRVERRLLRVARRVRVAARRAHQRVLPAPAHLELKLLSQAAAFFAGSASWPARAARMPGLAGLPRLRG